MDRTAGGIKGLTVEDVMTKSPVVARLPGTRTEVLRLMVKHRITGVPITHRDGTLAGFVARKHIFAIPDEEQLTLIMKKDYPSIEPDQPLKVLTKMLLSLELRHLPVVKKGRVVGIVTPADLLRVVEETRSDTAVIDLVRSPCIPIHETTPLKAASEIMRIGKAFALPVLDDDGKLSGIITDRDIFNLSVVDGQTAIKDLGLGRKETVDKEGLQNVMKLYYEESKIDLPKVMVKEVMIRKPATVFSRTGAGEAARLMRKHDYGQLPVRDENDRLLAMIYELDVVSVLTK